MLFSLHLSGVKYYRCFFKRMNSGFLEWHCSNYMIVIVCRSLSLMEDQAKLGYTIYGWMLHPNITNREEEEQQEQEARREGKSDQ